MHCTYGFHGERARRCRAHRLDGMVGAHAKLGAMLPAGRRRAPVARPRSHARAGGRGEQDVRGGRLQEAPAVRVPGGGLAAVQAACARRDGPRPSCRTRCADVWRSPGPDPRLPAQVNVVSKRCEAEGCDTQCGYGFPGQARRRCRAHRLAGMVRRPGQARHHAARRRGREGQLALQACAPALARRSA